MKIRLLISILLLTLGANAQRTWTSYGANGIQRSTTNPPSSAPDTLFRSNGGANGFVYWRSEWWYKNRISEGSQYTNIFGNPTSPSVTITYDNSYNAFPCTVRFPDGRIFVIYRKATNHTSNDGVVKGKTSIDSGKTWSSEFTVLSDPGFNLAATSLILLPNGNMVMAYSRDNGGIGDSLQSEMRSILLNSSGTPIAAPVSVGGTTDLAAAFGNSVRLPNGNIILPIYTRESGTIKVKAMLSTNNGASWSILSTLVSVNTTDFDLAYAEGSFILMPSGNIVAALRNLATKKIAFTKSTDNGVTWSTVTDKFDGISYVALTVLDNRLIMGYRTETVVTAAGYQMALRFSEDEGTTFSDKYSETAMFGNGYMYGSFVKIGNILGYTYGFEGELNTTSGIYFRYITFPESFGDIVGANFAGIINKGFTYNYGNTFINPNEDNNILINSRDGYEGSLLIQAGLGSSGFGGGLKLYGHSHPTRAGSIVAGISAGSTGVFGVDDTGNGSGTLVFTVNRQGNVTSNGGYTATGSITIPSASGTGQGKYNYTFTPSFAASRSYRTLIDQDAAGDWVLQRATTQGGSTFTNVLYVEPDGRLKVYTAPSQSNDVVRKNELDLKEDVANKSTTTTLGTSNTLYPTQNAVKIYVDNQISTFGASYVPYTGATANLNLGMYNVTANQANFIRTTTNDFVSNSNIVTSNTAIGSGEFTVLGDATSGNIAITLPSSAPGLTIGRILVVGKSDASANTVTINGNGKNINGAATLVLSSPNDGKIIQYMGTTAGWRILSDYNDPSNSNVVPVSGTTQTAQAGKIYQTLNVAMTTVTLPATATNGATVIINGYGSGKWRLQHGNATDTIKGVGGFTTVAGTTRGIETSDQFGTIGLRYQSTLGQWVVISQNGSIAAY